MSSAVIIETSHNIHLQLPYHSGLSLTDIEEDTAVLMILESLIEMSKHALDVIVWKLAEELEKLRKVSSVHYALLKDLTYMHLPRVSIV